MHACVLVNIKVCIYYIVLIKFKYSKKIFLSYKYIFQIMFRYILNIIFIFIFIFYLLSNQSKKISIYSN
jgi:hypothetical protein